MGNPVAFSKDEFKLMNKYLSNFPELRIEYSPSIKCPFVKEADLTTKDRKICKKYLEATVAQVKPSLIFSTGNLAMKMLIGKSGIMAKRGTCFMYGDIPVIPLLDPYSVIMNPSNEQLFERDINNGINKYIYKKVDRSQFSYTIIDNSCIEKLKEWEFLVDYDQPIAIDVETNGLNFLRVNVYTVSIASDKGTIAFPLYHPDANWDVDNFALISDFLKRLLQSKTKKVFQNAKFDCKVLLTNGFETVGPIWDTALMAHSVDETLPHGLKDLVKYYFPNELESL